MDTIEILIQSYEAHRQRTLRLLDQVAEHSDPQQVLGWRPGPGRAHIAWQVMHIGITEEIFATERLAPDKPAVFTPLWPRFRGGSTPDDDIPAADEIRHVLTEARQQLLATLRSYREEQLDEIPPTWTERGLTLRQILHIIGWHEAHHQGQAHITLNLYKAAHA